MKGSSAGTRMSVPSLRQGHVSRGGGEEKDLHAASACQRFTEASELTEKNPVGLRQEKGQGDRELEAKDGSRHQGGSGGTEGRKRIEAKHDK
eukprot:756035-Hanusia_phi.AAC.2